MKKYNIEIKWGIIFILMQLVWMTLEMLFGLHDENIEYHYIVTNFIMIPAIAVYFFALLDKRKNFYGGVMTFKQGFLSGLIITLTVTVLTPLSQFMTLQVITPDYFENVIEFAVQEGQMTREEAESYFNFGSYMVQSVIFAPIAGIITSALAALFVKKKPDTN